MVLNFKEIDQEVQVVWAELKFCTVFINIHRCKVVMCEMWEIKRCGVLQSFSARKQKIDHPILDGKNCKIENSILLFSRS